MDRVTYVIGAGFSAPLGLPVMSNFLAKSKDLFYSDPGRFPDFEKVFEEIKRLSYAKNFYSTDLLNIEEILSIQEMNEFLEGRRLSADFSKYIIDTIDAYTPQFEDFSRASNWYNNVFNQGKSAELLGLFTASILGVAFNTDRSLGPTKLIPETERRTRYSIISLNYDMVIENYADFLSESFGMLGGYQNLLETEGYDSTWEKCNLAKLHGSAHTGDIIPPTWAKGTHPSIIKTWKIANSILKDSNHIRFIGYSLPVADSYLKYLLKSAVIDTSNLKSLDVICMDGDSSVQKRYQDFFALNNFRFKNASITDLAYAIVSNTFLKTAHITGGVSHFRDAETAYNDFMTS